MRVFQLFIVHQSKKTEKQWSKLVVKCFNTMFSDLEVQVKARLAGAGEDWHTPGYLTRRDRKHSNDLTLCNLYLWNIKQAEDIYLAISKAREKSQFSALPGLKVAFERAVLKCR